MANIKEHAMSDEALIAAARSGSTSSYAELWRRHSDAALRAARQFTSIADADDLVAEAYLRILVALRDGGGPNGAFRPYLFVTIRNLAIGMSRAQRTDNVEDLDQLVDDKAETDPSVAALDRSLTVRAYRSLPSSWQTVLWYTEVEGMRPREVAPLLGMSANTVAALAYRARDALRTAWIQAHVNDDGTSDECRWMLERVGKYSRGQLGPREQARADRHIDSCARCIIVVEEADDIGSRLALVLLPMVLGASAGVAYGLSLVDQPPSTNVANANQGESVGIGTQLAVAAGALLLVGSATAMGMSTIAESHISAPTASPSSPPVAEKPTDLPTATEPSTTPTPPPVESDPPPTADPPTTVVRPPAPDPDPDPEPEPPADTVAHPPVVSTVLTNDMGSRPALEGTAEPFSVVTVVDNVGTLLSTVTADASGSWSTGPLTLLTPAATGLSVAHTDPAGNTSPLTTLGPFAFHPTLVELPEGFVARPGEDVVIEAFGWPGAAVVFAINGSGGTQSVEKIFDEDGRSSATVRFGAPGTLVFSARFTGADPSTAREMTITAV